MLSSRIPFQGKGLSGPCSARLTTKRNATLSLPTSNACIADPPTPTLYRRRQDPRLSTHKSPVIRLAVSYGPSAGDVPARRSRTAFGRRDLSGKARHDRPVLATGDGALGLWKAVPEVFPARLTPDDQAGRLPQVFGARSSSPSL